MKKKCFLILTIVLLSIISCEQETKKAIPPDFVVNRVTDIYSMSDGKHIMFLSSNMNREYDYGRLIVVEIKDDGNVSFKDSVLIPTIAGKMAVNDEETEVYVTSRDRQGVTRYKIIATDSGYRFDQIDPTDGYVPKILETEKEPYSLAISSNGKKLYVTHIISGSLSVIDIETWKNVETFSLRKGVTSLIYDEHSGFHLASHRESGLISVIETIETVSRLIVDIAEVSFDLPTSGYDIRSLKRSSDGTSVYAAFRNYSKSSTADTAPQLVKFSVDTDLGLYAKVHYTVPLRGSLGEIAVMSYSTGEDENEVKGDLVFISSPGERSVFIVDSIQKKVIDEITYDKNCDPYQLHYQELEKNKGILYVSCFVNDRIMMYDINIGQAGFHTLKGVIK
jgi:DNA-binding beta-propeller fold protein YncE